MQYVNNSPHQQGYGLRPWYEEENEADIALVYAFSFMIHDNALITFGCETGQIEGSKGMLPWTMEISNEGEGCQHKTNKKEHA